MAPFHLTLQYLRYSPPTHLPAVPVGLTRHRISTHQGVLEILSAIIPASFRSKPGPAILFLHGGMGSAHVWHDYMLYLAQQAGIQTYALSLRGHGGSWHPGYLRMVYGTTHQALADDSVAGLRWVAERHEEEGVVIVGHSSGGGLAQYILSEGKGLGGVRVRGLVLMAAVPGFGSYQVYLNWWLLDPWFALRMLFHLGHPNSPLSHPALTRRVFFSNEVSDAYVEDFQRKSLNAYESLLWPMSMIRRFADAGRVARQVNTAARAKVLVLAGGADRLMTLDVMRKLAEFYRAAFRDLDGEGRVEEGLRSLGWLEEEGDGVQFCVVAGAGHHLQNDTLWEVGVEKLLHFYRQL